MTEPISPDGTEVPPEPAEPGRATADDLEPISAYLDAHGDRYTPEALRARLVEAGHDPDLVSAAVRRRPETGDVRKSARRAVLVAYGITYLVFAGTLLSPVLAGKVSRGYEILWLMAAMILTMALGLALVISLRWVGRKGTGMGTAAFVMVPAVLLAVNFSPLVNTRRIVPSMALGLVLVISLWWFGRKGGGMGFAAFVVVPAVLLVLIGGACYLTTGAPFNLDNPPFRASSESVT